MWAIALLWQRSINGCLETSEGRRKAKGRRQLSIMIRIMDLIKPNFEEGVWGTFPQGGNAPLTPLIYPI
jgi:hypothetical protein